jgi:ribosomal protein S27E
MKGFGLNLVISVVYVLIACPECGATGETYYKNRSVFYKCGNCNANLAVSFGKIFVKAQISSYIFRRTTSLLINAIAKTS